jgi:hypothetical protein
MDADCYARTLLSQRVPFVGTHLRKPIITVQHEYRRLPC